MSSAERSSRLILNTFGSLEIHRFWDVRIGVGTEADAEFEKMIVAAADELMLQPGRDIQALARMDDDALIAENDFVFALKHQMHFAAGMRVTLPIIGRVAAHGVKPVDGQIQAVVGNTFQVQFVKPGNLLVPGADFSRLPVRFF